MKKDDKTLRNELIADEYNRFYGKGNPKGMDFDEYGILRRIILDRQKTSAVKELIKDADSRLSENDSYELKKDIAKLGFIFHTANDRDDIA